MKSSALGFAALVVIGGAAFVLGSQSGSNEPSAPALQGPPASVMPARSASVLGDAPAPGVMKVYKSPTCGCCTSWIDHVREAGIEVEVQDVANMMAVKQELGLPGELGSCHTAIIDGYLVEGHVPAEDIQRMLAERPAVSGIAVPGMPVGSPGMEIEGQPAAAYDVIAFDGAGQKSVYASH